MLLTALNVKTEYSMLQSVCRITPLMEKAKALGYQSLAIMDVGNMHGVIKFYEAAVKNYLKPIIGCEVNVTINEETYQVLLYAMDNFGYQNLMKIVSYAKLHSGVLPYEYLDSHAVGIMLCLPCACECYQKLFLNNVKKFKNIIETFKIITPFCFIGLSNRTLKEKQTFSKLYDFALNNNYTPIYVPSIYYLEKRNQKTYAVLNAIRNKVINVEDAEYHLEDPTIESQGLPSLLVENTNKASTLCQVTLSFSGYHLPEYEKGLDAVNYLKMLAQKGLTKRIKGQNVDYKRYQRRLAYELDTIHKMGFDDYFLIVWDFVKYAKTHDIFVGPGRGSAPASLVSYSLGITDIDPMKYGLLFERFLNTERITMPDIDIDFPDDKRDEVIKYVGEKYGAARTAHIVTFGTFAARSAVRDIAKVLKLNDVRLNQILKHLNKNPYKPIKEIVEGSEDLQELCENHPDIKETLDIAIELDGLPRNTSTHAAGIVMTKEDLTTYTPVDVGLNGIYQTQYESSDLEKIGLLKTDFLGLRNLTIIKKCVDLIKNDEPNFELPKEYNDLKTFQMITNGDTMGVFQLESEGMRKVLKNLKINEFMDIASAIALYRPGPMDIIPTFIARKNKEEEITYPHPDLEPILKSTYGTIVYQDQIILIAWRFAGYTLGEADVLRRAVSKKKKEVLEAEKVRFIEKSVKKGYSEETATVIYDYIVKFANYGFNKAHSIAYAVVAYLTAYLKCHYPAYYFSTLTSSIIGSFSMLETYQKEMNKCGIKLYQPTINYSTNECVIRTGKKNGTKFICLPLTAINGFGEMKYQSLLTIRNEGLFKDFEDFILRVKDSLAPSLIENIIYSGALDEFKLTKKAMIETYAVIINKSQYAFIDNLLKTAYTDEEYPYVYLLEKEKEMLGINIHYNFLHQYEHLYKSMGLIKLKEVKEKTSVMTLGIIKKKKEVKTTKGEVMCFITISDDDTELECTLFSAAYAKYQNIAVHQVYIISGRIEMRKNAKQLIVEEMRLV